MSIYWYKLLSLILRFRHVCSSFSLDILRCWQVGIKLCSCFNLRYRQVIISSCGCILRCLQVGTSFYHCYHSFFLCDFNGYVLVFVDKFVGGLVSYLRYLCLLAHSSVQRILCCVFAIYIFKTKLMFWGSTKYVSPRDRVFCGHF